jgi:hypothetical protein
MQIAETNAEDAAWRPCTIKCGDLFNLDMEFDGTAWFAMHGEPSPTKGWKAAFDETVRALADGPRIDSYFLMDMFLFKVSGIQPRTKEILEAHESLTKLIAEVNAKYDLRCQVRAKLVSNFSGLRSAMTGG